MTDKVAFLDVMDTKERDEIRSKLPRGFSIEFAETTDRREHPAMVADAEFVPLTPATKGLIGAETIARMKTGAIIINAARGGIVDEAALYDALVGGKLHGAGLDVFAMEPADPANPLFRLDQVVATPHSAGSVIDLVAEIARHAFTNMQSVLRGTPLPPDDVIVAAGENK
jgi:phosphoglycerate dehydrogenase-like enzyme